MVDSDSLHSLGNSKLGVILDWDEALDIGELGFLPGWDKVLSASKWLPGSLLSVKKFVLLGFQWLIQPLLLAPQ